MKNYYAILEVPVGCSLEEIRQAYRRLVQENLDNEAAFTDLKEAYEALTTPARRAEYDQAAWGETFSSENARTGLAPAGRCPMGAEAQCPVLQAYITPADNFCPECGYLLSALHADGSFDLPAPVEDSQRARLEEPGGQTHTLRPGRNLVGRESADVLIADKTISRQHAHLEVSQDGAATLEDLGSTNGTLVNDMRLTPHVLRRLADGDRVRFGSILTEFRMPAAETPRVAVALRRAEQSDTASEDSLPADSPPPERTALTARARVVSVREGETRDFPLVPGVTTFGRRAENSVVLQGDPYVSGSHAQIIAEEDLFRLTDLGSTNGTLLNGERLGVNEPITLSHEDIILIGGTALRFEIIAMAAADSTGAPEPPAEPRERTAQEYDAPEPDKELPEAAQAEPVQEIAAAQAEG